jgi:hypothetical protein
MQKAVIWPKVEHRALLFNPGSAKLIYAYPDKMLLLLRSNQTYLHK